MHSVEMIFESGRQHRVLLWLGEVCGERCERGSVGGSSLQFGRAVVRQFAVIPWGERNLIGDRSDERRRWWESQRLHGLGSVFRQDCAGRELKYLSDRLKTSGGIEKLKCLLANEIPTEDRAAM